MRPSTSLILVVGAIISFGVAQAAPVIYEPLDYPVGELNAQSGVAESGFDSAWNANVTSLIVADSLTYGTLPTQGGSVGNLSNNVNRFGGNRGVSASALAGNGLLADGATV